MAQQVIRQDHEQPAAIAQRGWRYHHLGIPTTTPVELIEFRGKKDPELTA
jgi:hypothetical protein